MILDRVQSPDDVKKLDPADLPRLAEEIRGFMVEHVAETGGHLAPSLGVVDLVIAMCRVFDFPKDRVIFDVGHQSYAYKILTGRRDAFSTLRRLDGISGFPKREESVYDAFDTGHSSTSLSAALGLAVARDLKGEDYKIISVIGDGALTGGMAYEAMNNAGNRRENLIVILNDNQMSISRNVGAMAKHLAKARTAPKYGRRKRSVKRLLRRTSGGAKVLSGLRRVRDSLKNLMVRGMLFEEMGFTYMGPVDGHDIRELEQYLSYCCNVDGPVMLHVLTKKGKGYPFAEAEPDKFHGIAAFDPATGRLRQEKREATFSGVFGDSLTELAKEDPRVVAITAAMPDGTGLRTFAKTFPDRFFDVGIAESHAVTYGAGLAANGMKPCVAVYSSFLQRGVDQVFHDVCLQNLPVVFAVDRAGVVGEDGETHQGIYDISLLRAFPHMTLLAPSTETELRMMLKYAFSLNAPCVLRYPKGEVSRWDASFVHRPLDEGGEPVREGERVLLLPLGIMMEASLEAADLLKEKGYSVGVFSPRFVKPLDEKNLSALAERYDYFVTVEDHVLEGGFGSAVEEFAARTGAAVSVVALGYNVGMIPQGKRSQLMEMHGLDAAGIARRVEELLKNSTNNEKKT